VTAATRLDLTLHPEVCARALDARDPRFDGLFFVGITTTGIYCRPVCPARISYPDRRRFFNSAAAAERAGYRPCLRCRPELAPGRALCDAVSRLARSAAHRIASGALNGRSVADLSRELGVSERHLRRSLEREVGVTPLELALTHRLLLAKQLLADTSLSVTGIAYASGFQSLRRFNAAFRERYRMNPTAMRAKRDDGAVTASASGTIHLTLAYRPPLAWASLIARLARDATPGIEVVEGLRYGRTVRIDGHVGVVFAEDASAKRSRRKDARSCLDLELSTSLLPALMPLLARLRQLFDLDAEPSVIDGHLAATSLCELVRLHPGMRVPGAIDGFEVAMRELLLSSEHARRVTVALGDHLETGHAGLESISPSAARVAEAGSEQLVGLGVPRRRAAALVAVARAIVGGGLVLEPASAVPATLRTLFAIDGISERTATRIVTRTLRWPDAFPASDPQLRLAARGFGDGTLRHIAEPWRPWRAYAGMHLEEAVAGIE
jgi:AraC family transcriptional regulator, regulatory protein of adaptative response / DNA-3-methyladenine glycosylase II